MALLLRSLLLCALPQHVGLRFTMRALHAGTSAYALQCCTCKADTRARRHSAPAGERSLRRPARLRRRAAGCRAVQQEAAGVDNSIDELLADVEDDKARPWWQCAHIFFCGRFGPSCTGP